MTPGYAVPEKSDYKIKSQAEWGSEANLLCLRNFAGENTGSKTARK